MQKKRNFRRLRSRMGGYLQDKAFLGTALLVTGFIAATPAFSQKSLLEPATDWSVMRIGAEQGANRSGNMVGGIQNAAGQPQAASPYCVVARRFENGSVLSIAGNHQGQRSIAVDFQKPVLSTSRPYHVLLKADGDMARAYEVAPVTEKAFVIRLGQDGSLFAALEGESKAALTVSYEASELRFDMSAFGEASLMLRKCLANSTSDRKEVPGIESTSYQPGYHNIKDNPGFRLAGYSAAAGAETGVTLPQSAENSKNGYATESSEEKATKTTVSYGAGEINAGNSEIKRLRAELEKISAAYGDLEALLAKEKAGQEELARRLEDMEETYRQEINSLKGSKLALQNQLLILASDNNRLKNLEEENARLRGEKSGIQAELISLKADHENDMAVGSTGLSKEYDALRQENIRLDQKVGQLGLENRSMRKELASLRAAAIEPASGYSTPEDAATAATGGKDFKPPVPPAPPMRLARTSSDADSGDSNSRSSETYSKSGQEVPKIDQRYQEAQREVVRLATMVNDTKSGCLKEGSASTMGREKPGYKGEVTTSLDEKRAEVVEVHKEIIRTADEMKRQRILQKRAAMAYISLPQEANTSDASGGNIVRPTSLYTGEYAQKAAVQEATVPSASASPTSSLLYKEQMEKNDLHSNGSTHEVSQNFDGVGLFQVVAENVNKSSISEFVSRLGENVKGHVFDLTALYVGKNNLISAYRWDTGELFGAAKIYKVKKERKAYSDFVKNYLENSSSYCKGDFKHSFDGQYVTPNSNLNVALFKIACVKDGEEVLQSTLFVGNPETSQVTVISHEGMKEDIRQLTDLHRQLEEQILSSRNAS